jgi:hypothetical protein
MEWRVVVVLPHFIFFDGPAAAVLLYSQTRLMHVMKETESVHGNTSRVVSKNDEKSYTSSILQYQ